MSQPPSRQKRRSLPWFRWGVASRFISRLFSRFINKFISRFFGTQYRSRKNSGFILPTATLLIVVVFLIVISLLARTANRVAQVAGQRERIAVEGPTSESVDRARAKIEFMFIRDVGADDNQNLTEQLFEDFLGNRARNSVTGEVIGASRVVDLYTLPDETRCGSQDGTCVGTSQAFTPDGIAPTWSYRVDLNGNGSVNDPQDGIAVYGIIGRVFRGNNSAVPVTEPGFTHLADRRSRAENFIVNNSPIQAQAADANCPAAGGIVGDRLNGRFDSGSAAEQVKNWQIYAVTIPNQVGGAQLTSNSVVFQQDRRFAGANKWGAWFRNDLEIFPGPRFNWNGAIYSNGSIFLNSGTGFTSFLISAPNSCYFLPESNSEIKAFGLFMSGSNRDNSLAPGGNSLIHLHPSARITPPQIMRLATTGGHPAGVNGSTVDAQDAVSGGFLPIDISLDPLAIVTENRSVARRRLGGIDAPFSAYRDATWGGGMANRILIDQCEPPPYVDDTFRADDRLGPKPSYNRGTCTAGAAPWVGRAGDPITGDDNLTRVVAPADRPDDYGLDGYWERRALGQGMKVIVGQRLELGNLGVWGGWRQFGENNWNNWNAALWNSWTATPSPSGAGRRIYPDSTNPFFGGITQEYGREIFGLLFRPNPTIGGIPSPGAADPLYPPFVLAAENGSTTPYFFSTPIPTPQASATRLSEQLHRRTQRDNLAAVQASAVYHRAVGGSLPVLCLSSTIHPGTEASYLNSITFGDPVSPADPDNARNVTRYPSLNANYVRPTETQALFPHADFFTGRGTANMEYGNATDPSRPPFEAADFNTGSVWVRALNNLANFAGDPDGAYPPRQATSGSQVYPDPVLTMWGNFSNLRRTLAALDGGTDYADLSPADQANLHTAGCTMGLLATNVHHYLGFNFHRTDPSGNTPYAGAPDRVVDGELRIDLQRLAHELRRLQDGIEGTGNFEIGRGILDSTPLGNPERYNIPAEYYIAALARIRDTRSFDTAASSEYQQWNRLVYLARMLNTRLQIVRDRTYGFREYVPGQWMGVQTVPYNSGGINNERLAYTLRTDPPASDPYARGTTVSLPCDVSLADINYFGYAKVDSPTALNAANPADQRLEREMLALARLCPTQPKNPSLFYLFPGDLDSRDGITGADAHGHDGTSGINMRNSNSPTPYNQPSRGFGNNNEPFSEPYVLSRYIAETANDRVTYEPFRIDDLNEMRLQNRDPEGSPNPWQLPAQNLANNRPVNDPDTLRGIYQRETDLILSDDRGTGGASLTAYRTGLAEKALFDGRQLQMTRVMDFDLDLLRDVNRAPLDWDDAWLSVGQIATPTTRRVAGGIIYAFREDAVREDAILRPANSTWSNYLAEWRARFQDGPSLPFRMNPNPGTPSDPPVTPNNISGKPVDYYADPDRRNHGFRLINGNDISRLNAPDERNIFGLTFITDNSLYIMTQLARGVSGFNLHASPTGGAAVQEFTTVLPFPYNFTQFYNRTALNTAFANPEGDTWRPAEILADSITLITHNFCDGYQEHGIRNVNDIDGQFGNECATGDPSARNTPLINNTGLGGTLNPPQNPPRERWARENPYDLGAPITLGSDGTHRTVVVGTAPALPSLQSFVPVDNYNAVTTRGNVPSRGINSTVNAVIVSGLVPSRRNQSYGGLHNFPRFIERDNDLTIQGSMIQLAFSNYGTAPFDFDSFERTAVPVTAENIPYYSPPTRLWGYDPALQYAPAGPVAERFITPSNARSEYLLELTADDPYTCQMKRFIIPGLTCPTS